MGRTLGIIADRVEAAAQAAEVVANEPLSPQLLRLAQRGLLVGWAGFDRRTIKTQPYWATGKAGL